MTEKDLLRLNLYFLTSLGSLQKAARITVLNRNKVEYDQFQNSCMVWVFAQNLIGVELVITFERKKPQGSVVEKLHNLKQPFNLFVCQVV